MDRAAIDAALEGLRASLDADGFDLQVDSLQPDGVVQVTLEARSDACHDCLVPEDTLTAILTSAVKDRDPSVERIRLVKRGF